MKTFKFLGSDYELSGDGLVTPERDGIYTVRIIEGWHEAVALNAGAVALANNGLIALVTVNDTIGVYSVHVESDCKLIITKGIGKVSMVTEISLN